MDDWRGWLDFAGFILTIAGLVVTLVGLDSLASDLFPHRPLPYRQGWRWIKEHIPFRRPRSQILPGQTATVGIGVALSARATTTRARPEPDAPHDQWAEYWDSRLVALAQRVDWANEDLTKVRTDLDRQLAEEAATREVADTELAEKVRSWLGGEGGSGLVTAWWGIAATLVGAILQGVASIGG